MDINNDQDLLDHDSIDCKFYDEQSMISSFSSSKNPIAISINIQSLSSKFEKFSDMISNFELNNLFFDVIAIQETWDIKNVKSLTLPSFHEFISKTRSSSRGGGVGFYIKSDLKYKIIEDLSIFNERIFESLCIEVEFSSNNSALFISLYRPPSHNILPPSEHSEVFLETLEHLLSNLAGVNKEVYILTDSNIDLLSINSSKLSSDYFNKLLSHGFCNTTYKATRFSKDNHSLIDQIIYKSVNSSFKSGVLIHDISDHCFPFCQLNIKRKVEKNTQKSSRSFCEENLINFKNCLSNLEWNEVLDCNDPEVAFLKFWDIFSTFFDLSFPSRKVSFNKNYHKINKFMTAGLLISRRRKLELYKTYLGCRTELNFAVYKN